MSMSLLCRPALSGINLLGFVTSLAHEIYGTSNRCRRMAYHELLVAFRTRPLAVDYTSAYIALLSSCYLSLLPNGHRQPRYTPPSSSSVTMHVSPFGSLLLLAIMAGVVCGAPQALKLRQSVAVPRNWVDIGRASPTHVIPLRIALPQARFPELEQHLAEISDPFHAGYGKHLSKEDVEALVAPHQSSVDAVYEWLESHGFQREGCHQSPAGDWVIVRVPIAKAEEMLGTVRRYPAYRLRRSARVF